MKKQLVTTVDLLRHGQTAPEHILRGRTDVPLSKAGWTQMRARLAGQSPWQQVITSPLQRCAAFAAEVTNKTSAPPLLEADFAERDYGDWDGRALADLRRESPDLFDKIWLQPHRYSPPNAEPLDAFCARVEDAWRALLTRHAGQHVLLISHGGVMRAIIGGVLQLPPTALSNIEVPFACFSRIRVYHNATATDTGATDYAQLIFHNAADAKRDD